MTASPSDHERDAELQVLAADECYRLLATQEIGRLGGWTGM
ncbi:hypothetical protein [Pseudonocardia zijingensis]|jgi:hypothetical protein